MLETSLHPNEQVIMTVRKHPLILVGQMIPFALLDYLPYLLPVLASFLEANSTASMVDFNALLSFDNPWVAFIVGVYWLFIWMGAFGVFVNHFLDQWVITNERIIDINQDGFWSREVSSLLLQRVQNVETDITGLFQTLFGFGTVSVETGGAEVGRVKMSGLAHPKAIRDTILKEVAAAQHGDSHSKIGI